MFDMGGSFRYLECVNCKSLQLTNIPDDLSLYYPKDYYAFGGIVTSSKAKNLLKKFRWKLYDTGISWFTRTPYLFWLKKLKTSQNDKIADIGCGNGQLIYELKCSGFTNLFGFDPYLNQEFQEKGFQLLRKNIDEIEGVFDIVMMHHSFEHVEDPKSVFAKLSQITARNGKLLIRVPITDGRAWKKEGINWFQLDAPRHLFIPSIKALKLISQANGFELKEIIFDSTGNQFWGPDIYKKGLSYTEAKLDSEFSKAELSMFEKEAKILNKREEGDQACFYFVKN